MLFVHCDISAKLFSTDIGFKNFFVQLNFRKMKWLLTCSYNTKSSNFESCTNCLSKSIDAHSSKYENIIFSGDSSMKAFCETYTFYSLATEANCFKNQENPSCIDLILTKEHLDFQRSSAIETGLSELHKMGLTVIKKHFHKRKPRMIA